MSYELIVIGCSLGGVETLQNFLNGINKDFPLPIVIVLHRNDDSHSTLDSLLQKSSPLTVIEVEDKDPILPQTVYLAPPGYHLLVEKGFFSLSTDAPELFSRPSINVLFESAAENYAEKLIGIILTGNNRDGAKGLSIIKQSGGLTIAENPETAIAETMPLEAIKYTKVDKILNITDISSFLNNMFLNQKEK
ncbi:MAG: chemotaxis protein CheB [Cyanobacteriota bacterium]